MFYSYLNVNFVPGQLWFTMSALSADALTRLKPRKQNELNRAGTPTTKRRRIGERERTR